MREAWSVGAWSAPGNPPLNALTLPRFHALTLQRLRADESVTPIHLAASGDIAAHDRHLAHGYCRLSATAGFGAAASGLSDHPGSHILSRREFGCCRLGHHRAARTAIRTTARLEPNDFDQLRRQLDHHSPVRAHPEH